MSEFSEIPKELIESVPSAAAHEEALRRDGQIRVAAWDIGIPQESLKNETVYRFASVARDVRAAHKRENLSDPYLDSVGTRRKAVPKPAPGSEADQRLMQYQLLTRLTRTMLLEGMGPGADSYVSEIGKCLDYLVRPLGTIAENVFENEEYKKEVAVTGMWSRADVGEDTYPYSSDELYEASKGKHARWRTSPDTLVERDDPEHVAALEAEATRQGLNPRSWGTAEAYPSLTRLVYARQLENEAWNVGGLPPADGLKPSAVERLERVAPLLTLTRRTLEEEFHPGRLEPNEVLSALVPVAQSIGRRIL